MSNKLILLCLLLIGCAGCSGADDVTPCYYTYMELGEQRGLKRLPVKCTGAVDLNSIYGQNRVEVASVLGPTETPKEEEGKTDWYKGGGIIIIYAGEGETATVIGIQPENLEFSPDSILNFLSITLDEKPTVSNKDIYWWDTKYGKIMANSRNDNPRLVDSIDILP